jgi:hypothetical protein
MTIQAGPVDGRAGCRRPVATPVPEPSPAAITGLLFRSIPTAIALSVLLPGMVPGPLRRQRGPGDRGTGLGSSSPRLTSFAS